jgi:hypothetical protein
MSTAMRSSGVSAMRVDSATAHRVGAHEPGHDRQQAHARLGVDLEEELTRGDLQRVTHHGGVRRQPHVGGIDAEQDVVHAGVADHHDLVDPLGEHARIRAELLHVLIEEADDACLQLAEIAGIELGEGDARHEVGPEHRLRVQAGDGRELLA